MPKSKVRKKKVYTPPAEVRPASESTRNKQSPPWLPGLGVGFIAVGIAWLVVFYISTGDYPVATLGNWNLVIGFGLMVASLPVLARWR